MGHLGMRVGSVGQILTSLSWGLEFNFLLCLFICYTATRSKYMILVFPLWQFKPAIQVYNKGMDYHRNKDMAG